MLELTPGPTEAGRSSHCLLLSKEDILALQVATHITGLIVECPELQAQLNFKAEKSTHR